MKRTEGVSASRILVAIGLLAFLVTPGCGGDGDGTNSTPESSVFLEKAGGDNQQGEAGRVLPERIVVRVRDAEGNGIGGETVTFTVTAGGGAVSPASTVTGPDGTVSTLWTMGAPPVRNRLRASAGRDAAEFAAWAGPGKEPVLELVFQGQPDVANEDLAFEEGRGLFLGSPGAILNLAAPAAGAVEITLTGEAVESPTGIAFGPNGDLYVCENADSGKSVKRVEPSGRCEVLSEGFGGQPFALPNHIAVHSSGEIYLSSTCDGRIYRVSPETGETTEFLTIPGPNGLALDAEEAYLYILTENPAVFCLPSPSVRAGLYRLPLGQPGGLETLVEGFALAGDGLAFDEEGNLYTVFSGDIRGRPGGFDDSGVFVYTPDAPDRPIQAFFTVNVLEGEILTNIAFGVEPFDPYSLYCYGFTGKLYRVEVGIRGRVLP